MPKIYENHNWLLNKFFWNIYLDTIDSLRSFIKSGTIGLASIDLLSIRKDHISFMGDIWKVRELQNVMAYILVDWN